MFKPQVNEDAEVGVDVSILLKLSGVLFDKRRRLLRLLSEMTDVFWEAGEICFLRLDSS